MHFIDVVVVSMFFISIILLIYGQEEEKIDLSADQPSKSIFHKKRFSIFPWKNRAKPTTKKPNWPPKRPLPRPYPYRLPPMSCRINEELSNRPAFCEPTCSNNMIRCPIRATNHMTCQCKRGFLRHQRSGRCLPVAHCCTYKPNEMYSEYCKCESSCKNPNLSPICHLQKCKSMPKCICLRGYYRNEQGICIPGNQCPAMPKSHPTIYKMPTNIKPKPHPPTTTQITNKDDLAENLSNFMNNLYRLGTTITTTTFPTAVFHPNSTMNNMVSCFCLGANEVFTTCAISCESSCDNPEWQCPAPTAQCEPKCQCQAGFVRDHIGNCIHKNNCPLKNTAPSLNQMPPKSTHPNFICCGTNQVFNPCGTCDATCQKDTFCMAPKQCIPSCNCASGYVRDAYRNCISSDHCPSANSSTTIPPYAING